MPPRSKHTDGFVRDAERNRPASLPVDKVDKEKKIWRELLKQLRAANPLQTITIDPSVSMSRELTIDGTGVWVRLLRESHDYGARPIFGRYYFVIGAYRGGRGRKPRPRAIEKKTGFDWARICQLVEDDRKYQAACSALEVRSKKERKEASHALQAMFVRRPELLAVEHLVDIDHDTYTVTMRHLDIQHAEISLSVALRAQEKKDQAEEEKSGYPAVAVYKASGERIHGDDQPTGPRVRWVMFDQDPVATRFVMMSDAEAEADSLNFLAQQEETGFVFVAERYKSEVPPAPVTSSQGGPGQKRQRRGRRQTTSRTV